MTLFKLCWETHKWIGIALSLILINISVTGLLLLEKKPLSTAEISETLGLSPSEVSRHMNSSSRQGLVRYDLEQKCYALP